MHMLVVAVVEQLLLAQMPQIQRLGTAVTERLPHYLDRP
jgi:hypothetical protein